MLSLASRSSRSGDSAIEDVAHPDAVTAARKGQKTAEGFYNIEHMLKRLMASDARVLLCGTCMDARGIQQDDLIEGAKRSSMDDLALATLAADKVIAF